MCPPACSAGRIAPPATSCSSTERAAGSSCPRLSPRACRLTRLGNGAGGQPSGPRVEASMRGRHIIIRRHVASLTASLTSTTVPSSYLRGAGVPTPQRSSENSLLLQHAARVALQTGMGGGLQRECPQQPLCGRSGTSRAAPALPCSSTGPPCCGRMRRERSRVLRKGSRVRPALRAAQASFAPSAWNRAPLTMRAGFSAFVTQQMTALQQALRSQVQRCAHASGRTRMAGAQTCRPGPTCARAPRRPRTPSWPSCTRCSPSSG